MILGRLVETKRDYKRLGKTGRALGRLRETTRELLGETKGDW